MRSNVALSDFCEVVQGGRMKLTGAEQGKPQWDCNVAQVRKIS